MLTGSDTTDIQPLRRRNLADPPTARHDRLIDAFGLVRQSLADAHLVIVGAGELTGEVAAQAKTLGVSVTALGWRSDVHEIYPAADAVVITSDNEGMPVTLIEVATLGIPCVTTDVGSASEVVIDGESGLVVPPSAEDVADALVRILSSRDLATRFADVARSVATDRFGETRMVERHARLYRRGRAI